MTKFFMLIATDSTDAWDMGNYEQACRLKGEDDVILTCFSPRDVEKTFKNKSITGYYITPECAESEQIDEIIKIIENERD